MHVIGLIGGVASGKSAVARMLADCGAAILDADRAGHDALDEPEVQVALRARWGESVFAENGAVSRSAVARIVFGGEQSRDERRFLETLLHPRIGTALARERNALVAAGVETVVIDAPLLLEAGWDLLCNSIVYVHCPRDARLSRAQARGWSEAEFNAREAAQDSLEAKRARADFVIDNGGSMEATQSQVAQFWREYIRP